MNQKITHCYKLVRDNIPDLIEETGNECTFINETSDDRFKILLSHKLIEETSELNEAMANKSQDKIIEEIVDIQTVINAILDCYGIDPDELQYAYEKKLKERGGFRNRVFLQTVTNENEDIKNY